MSPDLILIDAILRAEQMQKHLAKTVSIFRQATASLRPMPAWALELELRLARSVSLAEELLDGLQGGDPDDGDEDEIEEPEIDGGERGR